MSILLHTSQQISALAHSKLYIEETTASVRQNRIQKRNANKLRRGR